MPERPFEVPHHAEPDARYEMWAYVSAFREWHPGWEILFKVSPRARMARMMERFCEIHGLSIERTRLVWGPAHRELKRDDTPETPGMDLPRKKVEGIRVYPDAEEAEAAKQRYAQARRTRRTRRRRRGAGLGTSDARPSGGARAATGGRPAAKTRIAA